MSDFFTSHWLILNVLIPLMSLCFIAMSNSVSASRNIFIAVAPILLALVIFAPPLGSAYALGDWPAPIGIEYILDEMNFPFIIFAHIVLLLFSMNLAWIRFDAEKSIEKKYRHLLYAIIIAAHTGFTGILVTGDIFNLYVFIEIASLASYCLISIGRNSNSVVGAFEYLIIGTIAATLILIGIGMLYSATGTLNMKHMSQLLAENHSSRIVHMGVLLFVTGVLIKVALFPLHFWMMKAYNYTSGVVLTYIASISGAVGFYILLRFIYYVIGIDIFEELGMNIALNITGIIAILCASVFAYRSNYLREIVLFSAVAQVGYICIMIANEADPILCMQYVFADSMMKFALFYMITQVEIGRKSLELSELTGLAGRYPIFCAIMTFNLISNMGLPVTIGFFNKLNLLYILMQNTNYITFITVIVASIIGVEYNFKIIQRFYIGMKEQSIRLHLEGSHASMILATILGFGLIFI